MLIQILFTEPAMFLIIAVAILMALSLHEYFHALAACSLGDMTAKHEGRLTINPLAHLDPLGAIMLFVVGFGWGKPVPFNPYNLRNQKWGPSIVALSGPASNFSVAIIIGLLLRFLEFPNPALVFFLSFFVWINLILAVFNLMPVPPLDGSHIFLALFPSLKNSRIFFAQNSVFLLFGVIFFMIFIGTPFILKPFFTLLTGATLF